MTITPNAPRTNLNGTRNATLGDLVNLLQQQQESKLDIIAPAGKLRAEGGNLVVEGTEPVLTPDGVSTGDGTYVPTAVFDEGIAEKLGIPTQYMRRLRNERPDMYDANVNGWLHGHDGLGGDPRKFMTRLFRGADGGAGVARSMHSNCYARIDNLDVLTAVASGIRMAGVDVEFTRSDLTDKNMYVKVVCREISALAPELLKGYRSPFSGASGADNPTVFSGFIIRNSETGFGAASITPSLEVQVCTNGMTVVKDAMRAVHLGSRQDEGQVLWTRDTQEKQLALITAKARDAVATFLNVDYMTRVIRELTAKAGVEIADPVADIEKIGSAMKYSKETVAGILGHFIKGGDITAGGVFHAVTSFAQTLSDADAAFDLEASGPRALEVAAAGAR